MTDGPTRRETDAIRDDSGKTYEIHGDHATDTPREPRDSFGGETPVVMGGGAAGIGAIGINTNLDEGGGAGTDAGVRPTSDSGLHGSVAEAADLGQRPLRDYKRDADPALDATDTTVSATRSDTGPVASYTSDRDVMIRTTAPSGNGSGSITTGGASTSGSAVGNADAGETLTTVREGFRVVDASGDEIGKVRDLRSGDASAATADAPMDSGDSGGATRLLAAPGGVGTGGTGTAGSAGGAGGAAAIFALGQTGDGGEPNVDEPAWSRLSRVGFIKIDAKGWFASDRYAAADEVARVEGETVYLSVSKDQLISER